MQPHSLAGSGGILLCVQFAGNVTVPWGCTHRGPRGSVQLAMKYLEDPSLPSRTLVSLPWPLAPGILRLPPLTPAGSEYAGARARPRAGRTCAATSDHAAGSTRNASRSRELTRADSFWVGARTSAAKSVHRVQHSAPRAAQHKSTNRTRARWRRALVATARRATCNPGCCGGRFGGSASSCTHAHAHTLKSTHTHTLDALAHSHMHTRACTHTRAHTRTRAHTHTHTHVCAQTHRHTETDPHAHARGASLGAVAGSDEPQPAAQMRAEAGANKCTRGCAEILAQTWAGASATSACASVCILARRFEGTTDRVPREYSECTCTNAQWHTHTHTHTHPRTRTGKWEWAFAKRRKWERLPQQYPEGPPALAGGGTGCSRFARACLAANGCMRSPGLTRSTAKPTSEPAVRCHRAAYEPRA